MWPRPHGEESRGLDLRQVAHLRPTVIDSEFPVCVGLAIVGEGANRAREGAKRRVYGGNDGKREPGRDNSETQAGIEETPYSKGASSVGVTGLEPVTSSL